MDNHLKRYFEFTSLALIGFMREADSLFHSHKSEIMFSANYLCELINVQPKKIYRGVILKKSDLKDLSPHPGLTFISFTTDLKWACHFADPTENGFGGGMLTSYTQEKLGNNGYVIEYEPKVSEVIFHHKFFDLFPYKAVMPDIEHSKAQKEVMIVQPNTNLILQPLENFKNISKPEIEKNF
jgi:hypothetical protein